MSVFEYGGVISGAVAELHVMYDYTRLDCTIRPLRRNNPRLSRAAG